MADKEKPAQPASKWWCNFCGFRSDDESTYLKHSCKDELARQAREKQQKEQG